MNASDLKALREAAQMTQAQFADVLGINRVTLADMERGSAPIERRTIAAIEGLLSFRIDVTHSGALSPARPWIVTSTGPGRPPVARTHRVHGAYGTAELAMAAANQIKADLIPLAKITLHEG